MLEFIYPKDLVSQKTDDLTKACCQEPPGFRESLFGLNYKRATLIVCLLSLFQQLSGINIIMFYSNAIFSKIVDIGDPLNPL